MAAIAATVVKQLRDITGQSMMDCKNALTETGGDVEKAIELLRKKGMAVLEKRGGKDTKEGRVVGKIADNGKVAVITSLCCETDFTSKNENFQKAAQTLAQSLLTANSIPADTDALAKVTIPGGKAVGDLINDMVSQTGEKVTLGDFARFDLKGPGLLFCYVHFNGKVGTLLQIDAENEKAGSSQEIKTLASDLAMHITAINPEAVSRDEVDPELVAKERAIAVEQVKGKPANIVDKIVEGKLNKWYQQIILLEQPFVKDDSKTVRQLADELGKTAGGKLTVKRFTRLQIG
jgi:elongation factor Ts